MNARGRKSGTTHKIKDLQQILLEDLRILRFLIPKSCNLGLSLFRCMENDGFDLEAACRTKVAQT